ncbi:60S ribosomal protein L4-2 [Vitis vinifera]|uniref:60S ribosomal protein L4-2 n=2 Tax=Vitis vinifera TaxID=29760 RepID=A0A438G7L4_VITVI|nr:60S ribosomal protein L4-2 [Vitis vinifera]
MATDDGNIIPLLDVMKASTRPDIVNFIHSNISKNSRGGFHRTSQGASKNMCRGVVSVIATSAVLSLVMARGHRIESVLELPLVIGDSTKSVDKTSTTIDILKQVGACPDVEKAKDNYGIHPRKDFLVMKHLGKIKKYLWFLRAAGPLTGVVLGIVFVKIFHPSSISVVGKIPQGLPKFYVPKSFGICLDL